MAKNRSTFTSLQSESEKNSRKSRAEDKEASRKAKAECDISGSTSHTQFFRQTRPEGLFERITTDEYLGLSESISGSSDTFRCVHGAEGKQYTEKGLLKRNFKKILDLAPREPKKGLHCKVTYGWDLVERLKFLVLDPTVEQQQERLIDHLKDLVKVSADGYKIELLDSVCTILNFLVESLEKVPDLKETTTMLLRAMGKPILMNAASDVVRYFEKIANFAGFLGYLLMRIQDDSMFDIVSEAIIWHLSAPDSVRGLDGLTLHYTLVASAPALHHTVARMIAVATPHRFPTYHAIALLLACHSVDNCLELMKENIIENIFYRFNPYHPDRKLPYYDINPADPHDVNVTLGDSSVHMSTTLSLLLVLLKTTKQHLIENPKYSLLLPCPDSYAQRCFTWAYRYECRAREHRHQRITLTVIAMVLLHCFGNRLKVFSHPFMSDILILAVLTELPPRNDWTSSVNFNTGQQDVQFKKILIYFSVDMLKVFPYNKCLIESRHWLLGMMYLLDPGLCYLRARWTPPLFAELRKTALQALVCVVPRISPNLVKEYGLVRRTMWYIEWYSESPYELPILYWCVRLLHVIIYNRGESARLTTIKDLFSTHGIIIIIHLCHTLLDQKTPPVEKSQVIIGLCLRLLTSALFPKTKVNCYVYPSIKWPSVVNSLTTKMLDVVLFSLEKHYIISDRWLISLLNFIWEGIIWQKENREKFIAKGGIYKLLDLITMSRPPVQCVAMALVSDAARAGEAVGQLVSWRASLCASSAHPKVVKRGATIAKLLAAIFRDECQVTGVRLDPNGILEDLDSPIMSSVARSKINSPEFCEAKSQRTPVCLAAADLAGSRMSKAFALLHMLSEDLDFKVSIADEAYNLYKNVKLDPEDETILVLCAHYLTMKLNEVWIETKAQSPGLLPHDETILEEFLHIGRGWSNLIRRQQNDVLELDGKRESDKEFNLYEFLGRVRVNVALDALREVRCVARSADHACITYSLIQDAVRAHHRRSEQNKNLQSIVLKTYSPKIDDQNITGQNIKVRSIKPKHKPKPAIDELSYTQ